MRRDYSAINRAKLVDEPIIEMLLTKKYAGSSLTFMRSDIHLDYEGVDIVCSSNGTKKYINVKRNSSKHYRSPNFSIALDKNKLDVFKNSSFAFIDETADAVYFVDGAALLTYILEHADRSNAYPNNANKLWIVIPKSDIASISSSIIKYNKGIARLLEMGRDESKFADLT